MTKTIKQHAQIIPFMKDEVLLSKAAPSCRAELSPSVKVRLKKHDGTESSRVVVRVWEHVLLLCKCHLCMLQ